VLGAPGRPELLVPVARKTPKSGGPQAEIAGAGGRSLGG
jgi:hypothetical protein